MPSRQFAVLGLGRFGGSVGRTLAKLGYEVLGIDEDEARVNEMSRELTHAVVADATDESVLISLGIRNFDCVVVAIGEVQPSILMTIIVKELGVKQVVAKASNDLHGRVLKKVGADRVVYPERDMGARLAQNLVAANVIDYLELSPDYSIAEVVVSGGFIGKSLKQLALRQRYGVNVVAIKRGERIDVSPGADDTISEGDILIVIGPNERIRHLERQ